PPGSLTTEWPGFRTRNHVRGKHSWSIVRFLTRHAEPEQGVCHASLMCRSVKPKRKVLLSSCGGGQTQATGLLAPVVHDPRSAKHFYRLYHAEPPILLSSHEQPTIARTNSRYTWSLS